MSRLSHGGPVRTAARLVATALATMLLLDALRVFLPSLITIFGDAGTTPAAQLGGFALAWFAAGPLAALVGRFSGATPVRVAGAVLLGGGSGALAGTDGGAPQLYLSGVAVAGGAVYLVADALAGMDRHAPAALVAGIAASTGLHALLGTDDLVWRGGPAPLAAALVLVLAFLLAAILGGDSDGPPAPARYWGAIGPALLLAGTLTGATACAGAGPMAAPLGVGMVTAAGVAAILLAARPRWSGPPWLSALALPALVAATFPTAAGGTTWYAPIAMALAALALAACLGAAARPTRTRPHTVERAGQAPASTGAIEAGVPRADAVRAHAVRADTAETNAARTDTAGASAAGTDGVRVAPAGEGTARAMRRGFAAGGGLFGFGALVFGYYAAYDTDLGFPNGLLLLLAALWVGAAAAPWRAAVPTVASSVPPVAVPNGTDPADATPESGVPAAAMAGEAVPADAAGSSAAPAKGSPAPGRAGGRRWVAVAGAVAVLAGVGGAVVVPITTAGSATAGDSVRLVTYNIRMAYDLRGRFSVDRIAAAIAAQHPDVVLLNEVDRGWFLNGGHDDLAMIAGKLNMPYRFAPAADPVWGDAILTRLPVRRFTRVPLPDEGPTGAQALGATIRLPGGRTLGIVGTHFQPAGDVPAVGQARVAARLADRLGDDVVLAGDLNSEPGSPAMRVLADAGLTIDHQLASYPSDAPVKHIDHIVTTPGITTRDLVAGRTTASDHVPMAITLELG